MRLLCITPLLAAATVAAQGPFDPFTEGLSAVRQEHHQTAVDLFTAVIGERPDNARAWYYRGLSREAMGDHTGALHDLDRALLLNPGDLNMHLRRAESLVNAERHEEALADLRTILTAAPEQAIGVHARFTMGRVHVARQDYAAALTIYDELLRIEPANAKAWCNRGLVYNSMGEHEAALPDLSKAIGLDPAVLKAYGARARALIALDRADEACPDIVLAREQGDASMDELLVIHCL